ncbi:unnamed protein product [Hermetia illucens]|uniref:Uncharacterized protein n=1 Tax=Hermetia illucens TaxID=343691 RepID=A0A7R8V417_HERIL|nr:unnamed protein product [Hermetia illucens]
MQLVEALFVISNSRPAFGQPLATSSIIWHNCRDCGITFTAYCPLCFCVNYFSVRIGFPQRFSHFDFPRNKLRWTQKWRKPTRTP